uniref:Mitochondrial elongation factor 2 n=1 Tax=Sphenodon punctatus TaxID=8508 RepID=A0A8D0GB36_SPHPU
MSEFMHKSGKSKRDESWLSGVVDFLLANARLVLGVGGAAVLAIATLAVKRFIDRATSPPEDGDLKTEQKAIEASWQELSLIKEAAKPPKKQKREDLSEPLLSPAVTLTAQEPQVCVPFLDIPKVESRTLLCLTLQEKLLSFYRNRVSILETEMALGKLLAKDICTELQNILQSKHLELPFGPMQLSGPLYDELQVIAVDHVNFLLPLMLEPSLWKLIPGEETVVKDPRFWMIRRTGLEYFPRGNSPWDRFIVGGYLSSNAITEALHKILVASINWPAIGSVLECIIRPMVAPAELKLEVKYDHMQLSITLCPMVETGGKVLLANSQGGPVENLWQQSFYTAEVSKLKDLDSRDCGARQCCLQILKGICKDHPSLSKLNGSHLTHVLLHLSEAETDWTQEVLADRFQQVIEELIGYLEKGSLPSYFNSRIDLFRGLSEEDIDKMGYTLYSAATEPDLLLPEYFYQ